MTIVITVGGALVGLLCAALVLWPWWKKGAAPAAAGGKVPMAKGVSAGGSRNWKTLAPFGYATGLGILSATCVGGVLGLAARRIGGASNVGGNWLLSWLTGASSPSVTRSTVAMLQPGGAVVLIVAVFILGMWWRSSAKKLRRDLILGVVCGCTLGPTAGLAGLAGKFLVPLVNNVGGHIVGLI